MQISTLEEFEAQQEQAGSRAIYSPPEASEVLLDVVATDQEHNALNSLMTHIARLQLAYKDLVAACSAGYNELDKQPGAPNWEVLGQLVHSGDLAHFLPAEEWQEL